MSAKKKLYHIPFEVIGPGILSVKSSDLIKSPRIREQMRSASKIFNRTKNDNKVNEMKEYFDKMRSYHLKASVDPTGSSTDIEDMYQAFKERLIAELAVKSEELLYSGELIDTTK